MRCSLIIALLAGLSLTTLTGCSMVNSSAANATQHTYNTFMDQGTEGIKDDIKF